MSKPDLILMADLHLDDRNPPCRIDDYPLAQLHKLEQIRDIQEDHGGIPILLAGDVFERWKPSPLLLSFAFDNLPDNLYAIPGNHDLPAHNIDRYGESGLATLEAGGNLNIVRNYGEDLPDLELYGYHFGYDFDEIDTTDGIAIIHEFVYKGRSPFPGATGKVTGMMKKLPGFDLILCGDNHKPFTHRSGDQLFVNPGSIMRSKADQINHKPRIYLYYAGENRVEPVYLDIDQNAVTREHIEIPKERSDRIDKFVNRLRDDFEVGLSFEKNLKEFFQTNDIPKPVITKIMEAVNG